MPNYEYRCEKCGKKFSLILTLSEHDKKQKCPKCKSQRVTQLVSVFTPKTTRKS